MYSMDMRRVPQPFYRGMLDDGEGGLMVWFAASDIAETVREYALTTDLQVHIDGTFAVMPKLDAAQLFIMHADVEGMV